MTPQRRSLVLITALALAAPWSALAQSTTEDWPHLRGKNYDAKGGDTALVDSFPKDGPVVAWTKQLGQGYSAITVQERRCYTQYQTVFGQYVVCLDLESGETIWETRYDEPSDPTGIYPGPKSTPTIGNARVYFASPSGVIHSVDSLTGALNWAVDLNKVVGLKGVEFGYASTPLLIDGQVIVVAGGAGASLVSLDVSNGNVIWKCASGPASYSSPIPVKVDSRTLVVCLLQNDFVVIDPTTRHIVYTEAISSGYYENSSTPVFSAPYLFFGKPFRGGAEVYAFSQRIEDGHVNGDGNRIQRKWISNNLSNDVASSIIVDDHVYGFALRDAQSKAERPSRGEFQCIELSTGNLRWANKEVGQASPIYADGKLILFSDRGEVILAKASAHEYIELARAVAMPEHICWTQPTISKGRLLLRNHDRILCLDLRVNPEPNAVSPERERVRLGALSRTWTVDWTCLLGGEREHPFEALTATELSTWYLYACAFAWIPGMIAGAGITSVVSRLFRWKLDRGWISLLGVFLLGVALTPVASRAHGSLVLLWPASIYAALQGTIRWIGETESMSKEKRDRCKSRIVALAFLALCASYYALCQRLSLPQEAGFLTGLLFAMPVAHFAFRVRSWWIAESLVSAMGFSCLFWSGAFVPWIVAWFRSGPG